MNGDILGVGFVVASTPWAELNPLKSTKKRRYIAPRVTMVI